MCLCVKSLSTGKIICDESSNKLICRYTNKYLVAGLILSLVSWILALGSFVEPMTCSHEILITVPRMGSFLWGGPQMQSNNGGYSYDIFPLLHHELVLLGLLVVAQGSQWVRLMITFFIQSYTQHLPALWKLVNKDKGSGVQQAWNIHALWLTCVGSSAIGLTVEWNGKQEQLQ